MTQISVMALRGLVASVEGRGVSRARFLAEAALTTTPLDDPNARLPLRTYVRAVRAALAISGDPALGLHMGEQAHSAAFDVVGHLIEHCACLREAIELSSRYSLLVTDGPRLELHEQGDAAILRITQLRGQSAAVRLTAEFASSALLHFVRRFAGAAAQARHAFFAYSAPAEPACRAEYRRVFGGRERFSHAFTGLELERAWLDCTQPYRSPELCALLQTRAEQLLARLEHNAPATERVKRWLSARSLQTRPTMDVTARGLAMSARSLRRRLHSEGVSYSHLLEEALAAQARGMLADPRRSVQEIAYALGFGTPAAFSRAFKRWTGLTPSAYRAAR